MLAGLRLEDVRVRTHEQVIGQRDASRRQDAYPSLHLGYTQDDKRKLTLSYSRRVQGPRPFELNPFGFYQDPYAVMRGNPKLKPQITDAVEAGVQRRDGASLYSATAYLHYSRDTTTQVVQDMGGGVLVTSFENLGFRRTTGLEFAAKGKLAPSLSYTLNGNLYRVEIDPEQAALPGAPSPRPAARPVWIGRREARISSRSTSPFAARI